MNRFFGLTMSAPLRRACAIIGLAFFALGADDGNNDGAESKYQVVKVCDKSAPVAGYYVQAFHLPKLIAPDGVAFCADVIGPAAPATRPAGKPNTAKPNTGALAGGPGSASAQQSYGHMIFRVVGERGALSSPLRPRDSDFNNTFGIVSKKTFYPLDKQTQGLASFENGKQTELVFKSKEFPKLGDCVIECLDCEGDLVAFGCAYGGDFHVFSSRNGVVKSVYKRVGQTKRSGLQVSVGGGRVYVLDNDGIVVSGDKGPEKLVARDQAIGDRRIPVLNAISAAGGPLYFVGEEVGGSAIYTVRDGKPEMYIDKPIGRRSNTGLASYGETIAAIEEVRVPPTVTNVSKQDALVVHHGGERHVVAMTGETLFGQVIKDLAIDRRAVDAAGNVTFRYKTVEGMEGIGLAKPK